MADVVRSQSRADKVWARIDQDFACEPPKCRAVRPDRFGRIALDSVGT
jgi:hypothetical protein